MAFRPSAAFFRPRFRVTQYGTQLSSSSPVNIHARLVNRAQTGVCAQSTSSVVFYTDSDAEIAELLLRYGRTRAQVQ